MGYQVQGAYPIEINTATFESTVRANYEIARSNQSELIREVTEARSSHDDLGDRVNEIESIAESRNPATPYVEGDTYAAYIVVIGSDFNEYMRKTSGAGVDPVGNPTTWQQLTGLMTYSDPIPNKRFLINSQSSLENMGALISLTDVTSGVCLTDDTHGILPGDLFEFESGDLSSIIVEVDSVQEDISFTLTDTSVSAPTSPGTGHKKVPGYIGDNDAGPDGWTKRNSTSLLVDDEYINIKTRVSSDGRYIRAILPNHERYWGRTLTFAADVWSDLPSTAMLQINTDDTTYSWLHAGNSEWERLDAHQTISDSTPYIFLSVYADGDDGNIFIKNPRLLIDGCAAESPFVSQKDINLDADEVVIFDGTLSSNEDISFYLESLSKIPPNAIALSVIVAGTCSTVGKTMSAGQYGDVPIVSQVANVEAVGAGWARVSNGKITLRTDDTFVGKVIVIGVRL